MRHDRLRLRIRKYRNAAEIIACRLRDKGVKTVMFDVSVVPESEIVAAAFRYSHLVFASSTYNAGIFVVWKQYSTIWLPTTFRTVR